MHLHPLYRIPCFVPSAIVILLGLVAFQSGPLRAQPSDFELVGLEGSEVHGLLWDDGTGGLFAGTALGIWRAKGVDAHDLEWELVLRDSQPYAWWQFAADGHGNVYAGNSDEAFARSSDSGRTWIVNRNDATMSRFGLIKSVGVDSLGRVYIGTTPAVWRSSDSGRTWANRSAGLPSGYPDVQAFHLASSGSFFAVTGGIVGAHIYRSVDNGARWEIAREGTDINHYVGQMVNTRSGAMLSYAHREGVLRSTDDGVTWEVIPAGIPDTVSVTAMAHVGDFSFIAAFPPDVLVSGNDGRAWSRLYTRPESTIWDLSGGPDDRYVFAATDSGVYAWNMFSGGAPSAPATVQLEIEAWPNPTSGRLHVSVNDTPGATLAIVDALGRELIEDRADAAGTAIIDVAHLSPGPYLLLATARGRLQARRFVVVR